MTDPLRVRRGPAASAIAVCEGRVPCSCVACERIRVPEPYMPPLVPRSTEYDDLCKKVADYAAASRVIGNKDIGLRDELHMLREEYSNRRKPPRQTLIEFCRGKQRTRPTGAGRYKSHKANGADGYDDGERIQIRSHQTRGSQRHALGLNSVRRQNTVEYGQQTQPWRHGEDSEPSSSLRQTLHDLMSPSQ